LTLLLSSWAAGRLPATDAPERSDGAAGAGGISGTMALERVNSILTKNGKLLIGLQIPTVR
jgi:hypothetical protein